MDFRFYWTFLYHYVDTGEKNHTMHINGQKNFSPLSMTLLTTFSKIFMTDKLVAGSSIKTADPLSPVPMTPMTYFCLMSKRTPLTNLSTVSMKPPTNLSPVSMTPLTNLSSVSMTPLTNLTPVSITPVLVKGLTQRISEK